MKLKLSEKMDVHTPLFILAKNKNYGKYTDDLLTAGQIS